MNPAQGQLDPKLKETYDRVMGSQFTASAMPKQPVAPSTSIPSSPIQQSNPVQSPTQSTQTPATAPAQVFVASPATPNGSKTIVKNPSGKKISPVIFITLGVVFFAAYAVVWLKVFGIF